jgi:hypothetical protein
VTDQPLLFDVLPRTVLRSREHRYLENVRPGIRPQTTSESLDLYVDVLLLRRRDIRCFRAGRSEHLVGGELVSAKELRDRARRAWQGNYEMVRHLMVEEIAA